MSFENAKVLEEEYSGGFTDFDFRFGKGKITEVLR